ncbi:hypothetical protein PR048_025858 [Dryococelus australis]|uniref:Uncharacterized protein n=1 Tax=Dryococelus australis TaxID=614101 RepID=A0ABQ9GJN2_9NEOP|nr:hypothetical protein PR048_025858 [Dryococelus australis]
MKTEETNVIRISFDMEQNQPLPKLRNQNTSNTSVYTWTEDQSGQGSNEVTSDLSFFGKCREKV